MPESSRRTPHGETPYSPMSLLRALTSNPLDVEELRGTEGGHEEEAPPDTARMRVLTVVLALVLGFAVAVAVTNLRAEEVAEQGPREQLRAEVADSRAEAEALEAQREELQAEVGVLQEAVLSSEDEAAGEDLTAAQRAAATVALSGPGVVLSLDDSAPLPATPGVAEGTVNRVTDDDVQLAVNALWAAGAEGISVNGQRLSMTSAIRTAGSAVLVDLHPISPPYRITALGDPEALRSGVEDGTGGAYLEEISQRYGIVVGWESGEEYTVPARTTTALREASPLIDETETSDPTDPTPSPTEDPS